MDLRTEALRKALIKNAEETKRSQAYRQEHIDVEKNLKEFQKKFEIDCMVPIGTKALMPGVLYHTNEVLVCHFQGHFSKVSTHQALEIIKHRLKSADEHLKSLEKEEVLYEQNLEVPLMEHAFAMGGGEQEIIEDYDEAKENMWREQHRASVKKMKKEEAESRGKVEIRNNEDIFALLEEREMMEELENELEQLEIDDDDQLQQLLSGEIKPPPEKKRISHSGPSLKASEKAVNEDQPKISFGSGPTLTTYTNNNHVANQRDFHHSDESELEESSDSDNELPEEFKKWAETSKNLSRVEKINFYKDKLKRIKKNIRETRIRDENDLFKRIREIELKEVLEDTIDDLRMEEDEEEGQEEEEEEEELEDDDENEEKNEEVDDDKSNQKRRISFSNDVKVEYINSRDAPIQISLNNNPTLAETVATTTTQPPVDSDELPKFEPRVDYDPKQTVQIKFSHSENIWTLPSRERDVIGNPSELYKKVKSTQKKKDPKGKGNKGKWKEKEKKTVTEIAAAVSSTLTKPDVGPVVSDSAELKSILKNCNLVEQEKHHELSNNNEVDEKEEEAVTQRKKKSRETFVCEAPDFSTVS